MISNKIKEEDIAEELRILYVALTRAKEKLILIGSGDVSSTIKRYQEFSYSNSTTVPRDLIFEAKCIMDLMIMALIRHNSFDGINRLLLKEPKEAFNSHNDHRIVMAMSLFSTKFDVEINDAEAVSKSYPHYFKK